MWDPSQRYSFAYVPTLMSARLSKPRGEHLLHALQQALQSTRAQHEAPTTARAETSGASSSTDTDSDDEGAEAGVGHGSEL